MTLTFAETHNMVAYLLKSNVSEGFNQVIDFLNGSSINKDLASPKQTALGKDISNPFMIGSLPKTICLMRKIELELLLYALLVNPTIYVSCIKQFLATTTIKKVNDVVQLGALIDGKKVVVSEDVIRRDLHLDDADGVECFPNEEIFAELARMGRKFNFCKYIFDSMVRNVDSPSKFLMYPRFLQVVINNQVNDLTSHNTRYTSPALTQKVFANMQKVGKGFSGVETPLFASMLVQPQSQAEEEKEEEDDADEMPIVAELEQDKHTQALEILKLKKRVKKLEKKKKSNSSGFKRIRKVGGKIEAIDADEDITLVDVEKDEKVVTMDAEPQGRINQENVNAASKGVSAAEPTVFDDEEIAQKLHDEEVQKAAARDKQEKDDLERAQLKAVEVLGSESTQEIPSNDPKEMSEEDIQNMLEIIPVSEFKVEALQVKYPIMDWEIHTEGSRTYWRIIRVGGITEAYHSFEDVLKGFNREDLVALWNLVKEKFSSAVPSIDKESFVG
nr:hypothetical protein [Tanacetum cinerariifolium]